MITVNCSGLHCSGCGHGGKGSGVAALVVGLVLIATVGPAIAAGALELLHILIVAAIVILSVAVAAGVTAVAVWCHRRTMRAPATRAQLPVVIRELGPPGLRAIEPAHYRRVVAADQALARAEAERVPAEVLVPLVEALSEAVAEYRAERRRAGGDR
jgi:hypothetical protein